MNYVSYLLALLVLVVAVVAIFVNRLDTIVGALIIGLSVSILLFGYSSYVKVRTP